MDKIKLTLITLVMALGLAACNTMEGLGKDVAKVGDSLEKAAKNSK